MTEEKTYSIQDALQAQSALRSAAGLEPERFPVEAFVGMISDEIEALRSRERAISRLPVSFERTVSLKSLPRK